MPFLTTPPVGVVGTMTAGQQFAIRLLHHLGCKRLRGVEIEADDHQVTLKVTADHGHGLVRLRTLKAAAELLHTDVRRDRFGMRWVTGEYADVPVTVTTFLDAETTS